MAVSSSPRVPLLMRRGVVAFVLTACLALSSCPLARGFGVARSPCAARRTPRRPAAAAVSMSDSGAPEQVVQMAQSQAEKLRSMLAGAAPPPELERLEALVKSATASTNDLGKGMYELLTTMTLDYDADAETNSIEKNDAPASLEPTAELQKKMTYLYTYGMRMTASGLLDVDTLKDLIVARLGDRVGMTGEQLDEWLDV